MAFNKIAEMQAHFHNAWVHSQTVPIYTGTEKGKGLEESLWLHIYHCEQRANTLKVMRAMDHHKMSAPCPAK
jgi:hypothetical protein